MVAVLIVQLSVEPVEHVITDCLKPDYGATCFFHLHLKDLHKLSADSFALAVMRDYDFHQIVGLNIIVLTLL